MVSAPAPGGPLPSLTIGRAAARPEPARRLVLSAAGWAVLTRGRLPDPLPGFEPAPVEPADERAAAADLVARGVLQREDGRPVAAVAAQLEVLLAPAVTLRVHVDGPGGARRAWFAVGSGAVVGVLALTAGGVDLSMAPAVRLGAELARAVPDAASVTGPRPPGERTPRPAGRVPLALLADAWDARGPAGDDELAVVRDLERRTAGSLDCLVLGRTGGQLGAGQVSWLATDAGWVGLRPVLDGAPRRLVDLVPVEPADLGAWVAPTVAALLGVPDGQP